MTANRSAGVHGSPRRSGRKSSRKHYNRYHQRGRAIEAMASRLLERKGYRVIRSVRYTNGVHLVAWCDWAPPLFVHVGRRKKLVKTPGEVAASWPGEVAALKAIPRWDSMSVQLWIYAGRIFGWQYFEIFPSAVMEVEGVVA